MANDPKELVETAAGPTESADPIQADTRSPTLEQSAGMKENQPAVKLGVLTVQLVANGQVIASSQDSKLWLDVLAAITGHSPYPLRPKVQSTAGDDEGNVPKQIPHKSSDSSREDHEEPSDEFPKDVVKLASDIGVSPAELVATCDPREEEPYLHLDPRAWEELKKQTPSSGPNAISPIIPAATLLALWFKQKKFGNPSLRQVQAVLGTINLRDKKPARGLKARDWLQLKDDKITLNPARLSRAINFAKSFCTHNWKQENK